MCAAVDGIGSTVAGMVNESLARELIDMTDEDQRLVSGALGDDLEARLAYRRVTVRNADRLREILDEVGWPTISLVGAEAARRAWLVAQHADQQLPLQRRALELMAQAVERGDAEASLLAMLRDRVAVNEGRRQVYGTQIFRMADGTPVPWPCEDPERMDERRAAVGLEPFAAYVARYARP